MAQVALIPEPVPRLAARLVRRAAVVLEQLLGDDAAGVPGAHELVHLVPVRVHLGARAGLEVMREPRGRGEAALAAGTGNVGAAVAA